MGKHKKGFFERNTEKLNDVKSRFESDKVGTCANIMTAIIRTSSLIGAIVAYIIFIAKGNYVVQWNIMKTKGFFSGFDEARTTGTTGMMYGAIGAIVFLLFLVQLILILVLYFRDATRKKKIGMTINLLLICIDTFNLILFGLIFDGEITISEKMADKIKVFLMNFGGSISDNARIFVLCLGIIMCILFVVFIFMINRELGSEYMKDLGKSVVIAYVILPLGLLLLENVIPIFTGVIALLIIGVVVFLVLKIGAIASNGEVGSGTSSSSSRTTSISTSYNSISRNSSEEVKEEAKRKKYELVKTDNCLYVPGLNKFGGFKLYKTKGLIEDYIATDNGIMDRRACSIEDMEKGRFHIYESETGREIKIDEIPWQR